MSTKSIKSIFSACLLLGLLGTMLGCTIPFRTPADYPDHSPVRTFKITMDVNQNEELFTELEAFSSKHSLKYTLGLFDKYKIDFLVVMHGDGFDIQVNNISNPPTETVAIRLYNKTFTPTPQNIIDELFDELKSIISEIPSAVMLEEP